MDPQLKSILTSVLLALSSSATAWAASHGIIPDGDKATFANLLVTVALGAGTVAIGWWKARSASPKAMIQTVNAQDNGVKVVSVDSPGQVVNGPLK